MNASFQPNNKELAKLKTIATQLKPFLSPEGQRTVDECIAQFERQEIVVMVAGEVSVGKSSMLNIMLDEPTLITDLTETTAALTFLRSVESDCNAKADMAKVTYNSGKVEWLKATREALIKLTTSLENEDALDKVQKVEIFTDIVPKGLTIIDTPGLNGGDRHSALTHREMSLCHIALFLLDASKAGKASEKRELNRLYDYAPQVFFILNKWDLVKKLHPKWTSDDIKKQYLDAIGRIIDNGDETYTLSSKNIYVVSAKEGLTAKMEYIKKHGAPKKNSSDPYAELEELTDMLPDHGSQNEIFQLFQDMIEQSTLSTRGSMLYRRPLITMKNLAQDALDTIDKELEAISDTSDIDLKISKAERELVDNKEKLEERLRHITELLKSLAVEEQEDILTQAENAIENAVSDFERKLRDTPAFKQRNLSQMQTAAFSDSLREELMKNLQKYIQKPSLYSIDAFLTLVNQNLETAHDNGLTVELSEIKPPKVDFSAIERQRKEQLDALSDLQQNQSSYEQQLAKLQEQYTRMEQEIAKYRDAKRHVDELDSKIAEIERKIKRLGRRPGID